MAQRRAPATRPTRRRPRRPRRDRAPARRDGWSRRRQARSGSTSTRFDQCLLGSAGPLDAHGVAGAGRSARVTVELIQRRRRVRARGDPPDASAEGFDQRASLGALRVHGVAGRAARRPRAAPGIEKLVQSPVPCPGLESASRCPRKAFPPGSVERRCCRRRPPRCRTWEKCTGRRKAHLLATTCRGWALFSRIPR